MYQEPEAKTTSNGKNKFTHNEEDIMESYFSCFWKL